MTTTSPAMRISDVPWGAPVLPSRRDPALEREAKRVFGTVPHLLHYVSGCDWLGRAVVELNRRNVAHLDTDLEAFAGLVVSQDNSCRYCYGTQRSLLRMLGHSEARIGELEQSLHVDGFSPERRAALDFVRAMSRANPRPARAEREALVRLGYSPVAVAELGYVAASLTFLNRVSTLLSAPLEVELERHPDTLLGRLLQPFKAWSMRRQKPQPVRSPGAAAEGPLGAVLKALEGSPSAAALGGILEGALASPGLPQRAKVLVMATVGRALHCPYSEPAALALLEGSGLGAGDLRHVLDTLSSPKLDPLEAKLVPFARDTVRYRIDHIQQRMRELSAELPRAVVLEVVGITSLSNAICRLTALL